MPSLAVTFAFDWTMVLYGKPWRQGLIWQSLPQHAQSALLPRLCSWDNPHWLFLLLALGFILKQISGFSPALFNLFTVKLFKKLVQFLFCFHVVKHASVTYTLVIFT
jgi:hypothetical protein